MTDNNKNSILRFSLPILYGLSALIILYISRLNSYLLFHSVAETFSIVISFGIFAIGWNARRFLSSNYFLFIGIAFLFIGSIDFFHFMAYKGMAILQVKSPDPATQLWIAARYIQALSILIAPLFFRRKLNGDVVFFIYLVVFSMVILSILYWDIFPVCFREGTGLTPFKIVSEYIICFILVISIILVIRNRENIDPVILRWIILSIVLTIFGELAFTLYDDVYGIYNMIGHFFKIISFWCMYKALIETGLNRPFSLLLRELKQSEEKYRSLFINMINGFAHHQVVFNRDGKPIDSIFLEVNKAFARVIGLDREELIGKRVTEVFPGFEKNLPDWIDLYGEVTRTGKSVRRENYSELFDMWYSVSAYSSEKGSFVTIFEDITDRKKAEEYLKEINEKLETIVQEKTKEISVMNELLQTIIDNVPAMICLYDHLGKTILLNNNLKSIAGWDSKEMDVKTINGYCNTANNICEMVLSHKEDMKTGWVDLTIQSSKGIDLETSWAGVKLSDGSLITIGIDISERKEWERELTEYMDQLKRSNRDLQDFAFVASHDLQEPLRRIRTFGDLLLLKCGDSLSNRCVEYVGRMQKASENLQMLIESLLTYSRLSTKTNPFSMINLNEIVQQAIENLESRIRDTKAVIEIDDLPTVEADGSQILQLFQNLISNALKFHQKGNPPRIKIYVQPVPGERSSGRRIFQICVEDNGIGIEEQYIDLIFSPFQRLHNKSDYDGVGIGLSICKKIAERHRGRITVKSVINNGSTFIVSLKEAQTG